MKYKIKKFLIYLISEIIYFLSIFRNHNIIPFLLKFSLFKFSQNKNTKAKKILVFEKSHGINDLDNLRFSNKFEIKVLPRIYIKKIFDAFLKNQYSTYVYNYKNASKENLILRKKYENFLKKIFKKLKKLYNFDLIITFNLQYPADKDLHSVANQLGAKHLVLQKECLFNATEYGVYEYMLKNAFGKYKGDYILTYNHAFKNILISSKTIKTKFVQSIGMPRADKFFKYKKNKENHVLVLLVNPDVGFFNFNRLSKEKLKIDIPKKNWSENALTNLKYLHEFSKKNKHIKFIFKTKTLNDNSTLSQKKFIIKANLENWKLIEGGPSTDLIKNAKLIIGLNSTALVEGLILKKIIISPLFNSKNINKKFLFDYKDTVIYVRNKKEYFSYLSKILISSKKFKNLSKNRSVVLKNLIGNSDGKSSSRLNKFIKKII